MRTAANLAHAAARSPQGARGRRSGAAIAQPRLARRQVDRQGHAGLCSKSAKASRRSPENLPASASRTAEIAEIAAAHAAMVQHYREGDLIQYYHCNRAIHEAIVAAACNPVLVGTLCVGDRAYSARALCHADDDDSAGRSRFRSMRRSSMRCSVAMASAFPTSCARICATSAKKSCKPALPKRKVATSRARPREDLPDRRISATMRREEVAAERWRRKRTTVGSDQSAESSAAADAFGTRGINGHAATSAFAAPEMRRQARAGSTLRS